MVLKNLYLSMAADYFGNTASRSHSQRFYISLLETVQGKELETIEPLMKITMAESLDLWRQALKNKKSIARVGDRLGGYGVMKRWNGWGDEEIDYPLPAKAGSYLAELIGHGERRQDAALSDVISSIPESRLQDHPLITKEPLERLRHARGQSLPDWIALRSGRIDAFPDGVAYPQFE